MEAYDLLRFGTSFAKAHHSKDVCFRGHQKNETAEDVNRTAPITDDDRPSKRRKLEAGGEEKKWFTNEVEVRRFRKQHGIHIHGGSNRDVQLQHQLDRRSGAEPSQFTARSFTLRSDIGGAPPPARDLDDLRRFCGVPDWLIGNMRACGYAVLTQVQMQTIPCVLTRQPVLAVAPTGSGKTAAFLVPLLSLLMEPGNGFARALILCPSRELAQQSIREFERLSASTKLRGRLVDMNVGEGTNIENLDVAVATPLTLVRLCVTNKVSLLHTRHLVLDEADKMLGHAQRKMDRKTEEAAKGDGGQQDEQDETDRHEDAANGVKKKKKRKEGKVGEEEVTSLLNKGFPEQLEAILHKCDLPNLQILLFSATISSAVETFASEFLHAPLRVSVGTPNSAATTIEQELVFVTKEEGKLSSLRQLLRDGKLTPPTLIFVQSKDRAKELFEELAAERVSVDVMHADRTQRERDIAVRRFRSGKTWLLICTDLMGRGVDFKGVRLVLNYDLPQSAATYIHRIGRTGRAGHLGKAITFFTLEDLDYLRIVVNVMKQSGCEVPTWMANLKKPTKRVRKTLEYRPPRRRPIDAMKAHAKLSRKRHHQTNEQQAEIA